MEETKENGQRKKEGPKSGVRKSLLVVTLIPLIVFCVVIVAVSYQQLSNAIQSEVEFGLKSVAQSATYIYEAEYPGEYSYDSKTNQIYKGEKEISGMSEQLAQLKAITGADITFFYQDMRVLSTITNPDGSSVVGTKASATVRREIYEGKQEKFYAKSYLGETPYFSYYCPLYDENNKCIGMVFAGKTSAYVSGVVWHGVLPVMLVIIILMVAIIALITVYSHRMTSALGRVRRFLIHVESGNLTAELSRSVLARKDEIGDIGQSAVQMQSALKELIEKDGLTKLFNRRYGEKLLNEMRKENQVTGEKFYVAIADVDFFKKFNDRYGHDCGDLVLKMVSSVLKEGVEPKGHAVRWGGEEFLLLFYAKDLSTARKKVESISYKIRHRAVPYQDEQLSVTITMGFIQGRGELSSDELIKGADQALYEGKESGRDCIVYNEIKNINDDQTQTQENEKEIEIESEENKENE